MRNAQLSATHVAAKAVPHVAPVLALGHQAIHGDAVHARRRRMQRGARIQGANVCVIVVDDGVFAVHHDPRDLQNARKQLWAVHAAPRDVQRWTGVVRGEEAVRLRVER